MLAMEIDKKMHIFFKSIVKYRKQKVRFCCKVGKISKISMK